MNVHPFQPDRYGPVLAAVLSSDRNRALGAGTSDVALSAQLESLDLAQAFAHGRIVDPVVDRDAAQACLAGLWLLADDIERSHGISQDLNTSEGSYWHGIVHRREGDFGNARYWFRLAGSMPSLSPLGDLAATLAQQCPALKACAPWNPAAFVAAVQGASGEAAKNACQQLQQAEWELLFDHCYHRAVGT